MKTCSRCGLVLWNPPVGWDLAAMTCPRCRTDPCCRKARAKALREVLDALSKRYKASLGLLQFDRGHEVVGLGQAIKIVDAMAEAEVEADTRKEAPDDERMPRTS